MTKHARTLSLEEVRLLAELERKMDSGEIPYVVLQNERIAVIPSIMKHLELKSGQTISMTIYLEIMKCSLSEATRKLDEQNAEKEL